MARTRMLATIGGLAAVSGVVMAAVRHRSESLGRSVPGGILIDDAHGYDRHSRLLLGSFFSGVAMDIAAAAPASGRVLEVGCGPGHLSLRLGREHGLDVTGLDLDSAMIERARANADRVRKGARPSFVVGDVAALPFPDASFDVVISTLSMHHWADPAAGLTDIARVLRPGGRALIWDFRPGIVPMHRHLADPADRAAGTPLEVASSRAWRWPWLLPLSQRIELVRRDEKAATG